MNAHHQLFGLYHPGGGWVHRCPAPAKFVFVLALSLASLLLASPVASASAVSLTVLIIVTGRLPLRPALGLAPVLLVLLAVLAAYQLIFADWRHAIVVVGNLIACLYAARILTLTVPGTDLLDGLVTAARPLRVLGVDPERVGLAVALMIRSVPHLAGSFAEVRDAARARGLERNLLAQVSPVVVGAVGHAQTTGEALAARGLGESGSEEDSEEEQNPGRGISGA